MPLSKEFVSDISYARERSTRVWERPNYRAYDLNREKLCVRNQFGLVFIW